MLAPTKPVTTKARVLTLGEVILQDPQLAAALVRMRSPGTLSGPDSVIQITGGWETLTVQGTWSDVAANQMIVGQNLGIVETDLWVRSLKYTVQRPNAFAGSIFKAQSDYYNSLNPNINLQLIVNSYCRYVIAPEFTPLENMSERFECDCPAGLVFKCGGSIQANLTNLRALAADEVPTNAVLTFSAIRLPPGLYSSCDYQQAVQLLKEQGYLEPGG